MIVVFILSVIFMIFALISLVLHFVIGIDAFWFSLPLLISVTLNLISGLMRLKQKKSKEDLNNRKDE